MEHTNGAAGKAYGLLAEFHEPEEVLRAAESAYRQGFRKMDAYSPVPVEGLDEAIGFHKNSVALVVLVCGFMGAAFGMILLNGLPKHHHPIFNAPAFVEASQRYYFLCIEADDPQFDVESTGKFLEGLNPHSITLIENES